MLHPHTHRSIADQAECLASIASGEGEFGLANGLWTFEAKHRRLAEEAWAPLADEVRAGTRPVTVETLHALRKRHLLSREEFEQLRAAIEAQ